MAEHCKTAASVVQGDHSALGDLADFEAHAIAHDEITDSDRQWARGDLGSLRAHNPYQLEETYQNLITVRIVPESLYMKREDVTMLLDLASAKVGSDYKLAQLLGVSRQRVSNWRNAQQTISPEDVAIVANVAGLDASGWALRAMVAKHEGTAKGDRLMKAVGKALLATGAVVASSGAAATEICLKIQNVLDTMYIMLS